MLLKYGTVVWFPYTLGDMQRLDQVQNRFLNFASYRLNIPHRPHDYSLICDIFNLKLLAERRIISYCNLINGLIEGTIDAPRLLDRLDICIPGCTRFHGLFYLPVNRSHFTNNFPLVKMMSIANNFSV
jgi:hypothetical protein